MAAPGPCADDPCCTHSGARQTLDEMDFERGEAAAGAGGGPRGRSGAPVLGHRAPSEAWHELSWGSALTRGLQLQGKLRRCAGLAFLSHGVRTVCAGHGLGGL